VTSKAAKAGADPVVVVVTGVPGAGKTTVARALSLELGLPLLTVDTVKESLFDTLGVRDREWALQLRQAALQVVWSVLPDCPTGAIVDVWLDPTRDVGVADAVRVAIGNSLVLEVLCDVPGDVAAARYAARTRHAGHLLPDDSTLGRIRQAAPLIQPLGLGPALRLDTSEPVLLDDVVSWLRAQHGVSFP
jgi:predicted kinase